MTLTALGKRRGHYSSSPSSESPPGHHHRRKSLGEQALAALGLGSIAGAVAGNRSRSQDRSRSRDRGRGGDRHRHRRRSRSYSSSRSRSRSVDQAKKVQQALKAAVIAGATVAMRNRKEPGSWTGEKGKRVLTAAISAGGINELVSKDPDKKGTRHTLEAVAGGLLSNKILNGSRDKSRSRSRSRARSRRGEDRGGGLKGLATGGLAAAAGKALYDRARSKSRGRRSSRSSSDSRSPPRHKKRSKSVSEYISRGMEIVGLGESGKDKHRDDRSSRRDRDYDDRYGRDRSPQHARLRGGGGDWGDGVTGESSSSDDISSEEDRRTKTKMHRKEYLTAGLASVATIHAANSVYKSVDARKKRAKLVKSGVMTAEEAHKLKNKARLQDAAAVGIAAIGIKGAVSEWKEMHEQREKCREFDRERAERHERRLKRLEDHLASDQHHSYHGAIGYDGGPFYEDGNPYRSTPSLPLPPIGRHQSSFN